MEAILKRNTLHGGQIHHHGSTVEGDLAEELVALGAATWPTVEVKPDGSAPAGVEPDGPGRAAPDPDTAPDLATDLVAAIGKLEPDNAEHWTQGGKPDTRALETVLGRKVSAAERDAAWASVQSSQAGGQG